MRSHRMFVATGRGLACGWVFAGVLAAIATSSALAGQRQFLVILATSPKQNANPVLPNPQTIENEYFNGPDSFAEYWREVSYGDVTINGTVTDWLQLPWSVQPDPARLTGARLSFVDLNESGTYDYGIGEPFDHQKAMLIVDVDGDDANGGSNGPDAVEDNPSYAQGGKQMDRNGLPVWTPGERFVDMDGDGKWDGLDEATNQMDWNGDGRPDLLGPWVDLNQDGVPNNENGCVYLPDSDNDGNPDCCPNGPGLPGCGGVSGSSEAADAASCPPTNLLNPDQTTATDCNGNFLDDADDIESGHSLDRLPFVAVAGACVAGTGDGIPDECQFSESADDCRSATLNCPPDAQNPDPCCSEPACVALTDGPRVAGNRCEFDDANGNGTLDIVEPFENFFARGKLVAEVRRDDPDFCENKLDDAYTLFNFPGEGAASVAARNDFRQLYGPHDPLDKITSRCTCTDGSFCVTIPAQGAVPAIVDACPAGEHVQYDPPDFWEDRAASRKMWVDRRLLRNFSTPKPLWYEQAWRDRYGTEPPPWETQTLAARPVPSEGVDARREFIADRGGLDGKGVGWIGCDDAADLRVKFATGLCSPPGNGFDVLCNQRILPEETAGVGEVLIVYDGWLEYDDLPSSKYHQAGDQGLGEVTSPFSTNIWGQDRGPNNSGPGSGPDFVLPAAGPYATQLHGQFGRDAGNVLQMELLTRRTNNCCPPATPNCPAHCESNGAAWEEQHTYHQFAGPGLGLGIGFRDYNLDGLIDLGESVEQGSENYLADPTVAAPRGSATQYPWNRRRLLEDCIEVLDDVIDFDDFVDPVSMDQVTCGQGALERFAPVPFDPNFSYPVAGIQSGIVLLPGGSLQSGDFRGATQFRDPILLPIHTEDGLTDSNFAQAVFPKPPYSSGAPGQPPLKSPQLAKHLLFHDLVFDLSATAGGGSIPSGGGQTAYSAHEYLHTWHSFPDLYDYDVYDNPPGRLNCHVGRWDIMADGGLVHPTPILKAAGCTEWVAPVDLATILTPGVEKILTLPPVEFVRDDSYYFLSNEDRPGEQFWVWSAGSGFDQRMPAPGVLVMHTDVSNSNPDALPQQQRSGDRPHYAIVQADGRSDLKDCTTRGDAGDPFPGTANQPLFNCQTLPASEWYTDSACTGLELRNITPDDAGSATVAITWTPTSIPSLRFVDPPGGVSVGNPPNAVYNVRSEVNDVFGGTRVRFFYTTSDAQAPDPTASTSHAISLVRKTTPGLTDLSTDWNVSSLADGRYFLFADLIPGLGADGQERKLTDPRAGRNNQGTAVLATNDVEVLTSTLNAQGQVATQGRARSETWTMRCINATTGEWLVNSSLSLPDPPPDALDQDPYTHAFTDQRYLPARCTGPSTNRVCTPVESVAFTIRAGNAGATKGAVGDTFTFTTTGITARSEGVTLRGGRISEDPVAAIDATPLSGLPPLTVSFDARSSIDPNGAPLTYRWDFGDRTPVATGAQVTHTYGTAETFGATLRATNPTGRFGEASVDIRVINNTPNAVIRAAPNSGLAPLVVSFNASQSSDAETTPEQLIYQWEFGDGTSANDLRVPGLSFREVSHTYSRKADGTQCTVAAPCTFTARLTVTDAGGVSDSATVDVRIGNTNPVPNVTFTLLTGPTPLTVTFNAKTSTDAESDPIEVEWNWGDGTANETYRAATGKAPATDGSVPHIFVLPAGEVTRSFTVRATLRDLTATGTRKGGESTWPGVTVTVIAVASDQNHPPTARFTVTPEVGVAEENMSFDATTSTDADGDDLRYRWDFGDGTTTQFGANPIAVHAFDEEGTYTVRLTVEDEEAATATVTRVVRVLGEGVNRDPVAIIATGPRTGPAPLSQTFDGTLSFDSDGDALSYSWAVRSGDILIDTLTGQIATRMFTTQGTFTVTLTVRDVRGGEDIADPVTVVVAGEVVPPDEPEPPRPFPEEPPDSANQRPTPIACGLGMVAALFGTLTGLGLTAMLRRRKTG